MGIGRVRDSGRVRRDRERASGRLKTRLFGDCLRVRGPTGGGDRDAVRRPLSRRDAALGRFRTHRRHRSVRVTPVGCCRAPTVHPAHPRPPRTSRAIARSHSCVNAPLGELLARELGVLLELGSGGGLAHLGCDGGFCLGCGSGGRLARCGCGSLDDLVLLRLSSTHTMAEVMTDG